MKPKVMAGNSHQEEDDQGEEPRAWKGKALNEPSLYWR